MKKLFTKIFDKKEVKPVERFEIDTWQSWEALAERYDMMIRRQDMQAIDYGTEMGSL